jgi:hypothetical protein
MPKQTKSKVNEAGNYTKPAMRKQLFNKIKAGSKGGKPDSVVGQEGPNACQGIQSQGRRVSWLS